MPELWRDGIDAATAGRRADDLAHATRADWIERYEELGGATRSAARSSPARACGSATGPSTSAATRATCARSRRARRSTSRATTPPTRATALARDARASIATASGSPRCTARCADAGVRLVARPRARRLPGSLGGVRAFSASAAPRPRSTGASAARGSPTARNLAGICSRPSSRSSSTLARTARSARDAASACGSLAALPLLLAFDVAWAAGEARGHVDSAPSR